MRIRPITEVRDLQDCVALQREAWGLADIEIIPVRMLITQNRVGGLVLGAFENEQLIGFLTPCPAFVKASNIGTPKCWP